MSGARGRSGFIPILTQPFLPDDEDMTSQMPPSPPPAPTTKQLYRDPNGKVGGVCAGVAHYLDLDVALVRILFLLLVVTLGTGVLAYLIAWAVIPESPVALTH